MYGAPVCTSKEQTAEQCNAEGYKTAHSGGGYDHQACDSWQDGWHAFHRLAVATDGWTFLDGNRHLP